MIECFGILFTGILYFPFYYNNVYLFPLFILLFSNFFFVNIIQSASYSFCMKNVRKKVIENFGCAKKGCNFAPAFWEQRAAEIEKLNRERLRFSRIRLLPFAREPVSQVASKKSFEKNFRKNLEVKRKSLYLCTRFPNGSTRK